MTFVMEGKWGFRTGALSTSIALCLGSVEAAMWQHPGGTRFN